MTAALGSGSAPLPSLPQPRPRAPRVILQRPQPVRSRQPTGRTALPRLRIRAPTGSQVHDALNLLTDSSATWDARALPPVASAPDVAGRDRDSHRTPSRQSLDRTLKPVDTAAALASGSTTWPLLPQPWARPLPLLLGSGPSRFEATHRPSKGRP
jgi:hypothetical protein